MPEYLVPRFSDAPLAFSGELLATVSGQNTRPEKTNKRWHEIDLFRTDSGKFVVAVRFRCETSFDDPYDDAEALDSSEVVVRFLNEFDPCEHIRGWPRPSHAQQDDRLRDALTNSFDRLVAQLIGSRAEFAERV